MEFLKICHCMVKQIFWAVFKLVYVMHQLTWQTEEMTKRFVSLNVLRSLRHNKTLIGSRIMRVLPTRDVNHKSPVTSRRITDNLQIICEGLDVCLSLSMHVCKGLCLCSSQGLTCVVLFSFGSSMDLFWSRLATSSRDNFCVTLQGWSRLSVCAPSTPMWFLISWYNFEQLLFSEKKNVFNIYLFWPKMFFSCGIFGASECFMPKHFSDLWSKCFLQQRGIFSPKNSNATKFYKLWRSSFPCQFHTQLWVQQGTTQCFQAFWFSFVVTQAMQLSLHWQILLENECEVFGAGTSVCWVSFNFFPWLQLRLLGTWLVSQSVKCMMKGTSRDFLSWDQIDHKVPSLWEWLWKEKAGPWVTDDSVCCKKVRSFHVWLWQWVWNPQNIQMLETNFHL